MKLMLKIVGGIVIAVIVLTAGCAALIGAGANEVVKESNKHSITRGQFRALQTGATLRAVKAELGQPADDQEMNVSLSEFGVESRTDCIYYNEQDEILSMYQFCFDNGRLTSKNRY